MDRSRSEALFNALVSLYKDRKLDLSDYKNPTKVILIGDHGNHIDDDKGLTTESVAKILGSTVVINAIQVHTDSANKIYVDRFKEQVEEIISLRDSDSIDKAGRLIVDNTGSPETIKSNIESCAKISKKTTRLVRQVYSGDINLTDKEKDFLKLQLKIDVDNLGKVQQSLELYINNNQKNKYDKVILSGAELANDLSSAYNKIAKAISVYKSDKVGTTRLKQGLKSAIETLTGQEILDSSNVAEFMAQRLKIPKSKILDMTFDEWLDEIGANRDSYRKNIIRNFREKAVHLNALYNEKEAINIKFNVNNEVDYDEKLDDDGDILKKQSKFNISIVSRDGYDRSDSFKNKWIWIPFKYMP